MNYREWIQYMVETWMVVVLEKYRMQWAVDMDSTVHQGGAG
jgi:hypothetical protein